MDPGLDIVDKIAKHFLKGTIQDLREETEDGGCERDEAIMENEAGKDTIPDCEDL